VALRCSSEAAAANVWRHVLCDIWKYLLFTSLIKHIYGLTFICEVFIGLCMNARASRNDLTKSGQVSVNKGKECAAFIPLIIRIKKNTTPSYTHGVH
jgi:hypothetical protein